MPKFLLLGFLLLTVTGCMTSSLFPKTSPLEEVVLSGEGRDKILLVEVSGVLTSAKPGGVLDRFFDRLSLPARFKEELAKAEDDEDVKAVVFRINTPGGTVTASDILYHEIQELKKIRDIPVIASIMDLGTSGGYYVAMATDQVVAHPSSVTGSLGVIMLTLNASGLMEKIGVRADAVTSGPHKDMGSPFRTMTEQDRAIFQGVIDNFYDRFLRVIERGRPNLKPETIRRLADGRIYSATQAKDHGLVDVIGYLDDAIGLAKKKAGIEEAQVVMYQRAGGYHPNIYAQGPGGLARTDWTFPKLDPVSLLLAGGTPSFMYLWLP
jgi:protease-4